MTKIDMLSDSKQSILHLGIGKLENMQEVSKMTFEIIGHFGGLNCRSLF